MGVQAFQPCELLIEFGTGLRVSIWRVDRGDSPPLLIFDRASAAVPAVAVCALLMKLIPADPLERWQGDRAKEHAERIISLAVGLLALAMGLVGLYLKRRLPERHMSMGSRDMIGAIMGLLSLLLALVLRTAGRFRAPVLHQPKGRTRIARRPVARTGAGFPPIRTRDRALATDDENLGAGSL